MQLEVQIRMEEAQGGISGGVCAGPAAGIPQIPLSPFLWFCDPEIPHLHPSLGTNGAAMTRQVLGKMGQEKLIDMIAWQEILKI